MLLRVEPIAVVAVVHPKEAIYILKRWLGAVVAHVDHPQQRRHRPRWLPRGMVHGRGEVLCITVHYNRGKRRLATTVRAAARPTRRPAITVRSRQAFVCSAGLLDLRVLCTCRKHRACLRERHGIPCFSAMSLAHAVTPRPFP